MKHSIVLLFAAFAVTMISWSMIAVTTTTTTSFSNDYMYGSVLQNALASFVVQQQQGKDDVVAMIVNAKTTTEVSIDGKEKKEHDPEDGYSSAFRKQPEAATAAVIESGRVKAVVEEKTLSRDTPKEDREHPDVQLTNGETVSIQQEGAYSSGAATSQKPTKVSARSEQSEQSDQEDDSVINPDPFKIQHRNPTFDSHVFLTFCKQCPQECVAEIQTVATDLFHPQEAIRNVVGKNSTFCQACTVVCHVNLIQPLGFDEVLPEPPLRAQTYVTLPSIPEDRRIVSAQQLEGGKTAMHGPLSLYNPSIVVLPPTMKQPFTGVYPAEPSFVASFRVTDVGACYILPDFDWRDRGSNLVALALLSRDLQVLDHTILDINQAVPHSQQRVFEDFRLFYIQETLYLSHSQFYIPIEITHTTQQLIEPPVLIIAPWNNQTNTRLVVSIPAGSPTTISKLGRSMKGKNFQYFSDRTNNASFVEFWPMQPHMVGKLEDRQILSVAMSNDNETLYYPPPESFLARQKFPSTNDRGSACCIRLEQRHLPTGSSTHRDFVYMGISHVRSKTVLKKKKKSTNQKVYLSRLYAFEPTWPFEIVARSGLFCLGAGTSTPEPYSTLQQPLLLKLGRNSYDCPAFHYISGMSDASNESALIAYGILDCTSRIVEYRKTDLARILFTNLNTSQRVV